MQVQDGWQQGRGAFGGLVLGALARAMGAVQPDPERRLRSLSGEIAGPVQPGAAAIEVATIRRGSGLSFLEARLLQEGAVLARASGLFGETRGYTRSWSAPPPAEALRPFQERPVAPIGPPLAPIFTPHFEFRPTGPLPFSGGSEPVAEGWIRPRAPLEVWGDLEVIATLDAWWPTLFSTETAPRPIATVAFTCELLRDPATLPADQPLLHRARSDAGGEGFFVEFRELWSSDGALVALNQQTFAVIR